MNAEEREARWVTYNDKSRGYSVLTRTFTNIRVNLNREGGLSSPSRTCANQQLKILYTGCLEIFCTSEV